tara:strand:+ start:2028 stop:2177 length:150 start_codon:yes stop_codon:yes gene_type:complete
MRLRSGRIISKQIISDVEVAKILLSLKEKKIKEAIKKSILKQINIKITN